MELGTPTSKNRTDYRREFALPFAELVREMRTAQVAYRKRGSRTNYNRKVKLENRVDAVLREA